MERFAAILGADGRLTSLVKSEPGSLSATDTSGVTLMQNVKTYLPQPAAGSNSLQGTSKDNRKINSIDTKLTEKTEKRVRTRKEKLEAHNVVERKRRRGITDQIQQLRQEISEYGQVDCSKWSKASVIKAGNELIKDLKSENAWLKGENEQLKGENEQLKGENEQLKQAMNIDMTSPDDPQAMYQFIVDHFFKVASESEDSPLNSMMGGVFPIRQISQDSGLPDIIQSESFDSDIV